MGLEDKLSQLHGGTDKPAEPPLPILDIFDRITVMENRYRSLPAPVAASLKRKEPPIGLGVVSYVDTKEHAESYNGVHSPECIFRVASITGWDTPTWNAAQRLAHAYDLAIQDGSREYNNVVVLKDPVRSAAAIHLDTSNNPPRHLLYIAWEYPRRDELFLDLMEHVYHASLDGQYRARPRPAPAQEKASGGLFAFIGRLFGKKGGTA